MAQTIWTEDEYEYGIEHYDEGVALAKVGELFGSRHCNNSFAGFRKAFSERYGRDTKLTDDEIIVLWMSSDDDHDTDDWWLARAESAEEYFATSYTGPVLDAYTKSQTKTTTDED